MASVEPAAEERPGDKPSKKPLLVFVEPYSNPAKDSKRRGHQEIVKRWSMLNRNATFVPPRDSPSLHADAQSHAPSASGGGMKGRLVPKRPRRNESFQPACPQLPWFSDAQLLAPLDPFMTMPIEMDQHSDALLHSYLSYVPSPVKTTFKVDRLHSTRLIDARKAIWAPLAMSSKSSCHALITFAAATQFVKDPNPASIAQLERNLGKALHVTNQALADSSLASSNEVIMSVAMLILVARCMRDDASFKAHSRGLAALLELRRQDPIAPRWTLFGPPGATVDHMPDAQERLATPFVGNGFFSLYRVGAISPHAWETHYQTAFVISQLVLSTGGDIVWYGAMQQHMWLIEEPTEEEGTSPLDRLLLSAVRLGWHLVIFQGYVRTSLVVIATTRAIQHAFPLLHLEHFGPAASWALLWVAMIGCVSNRSPNWFRDLLRYSLTRLESMTFDQAVDAMEAKFFWHPSLCREARLAWEEAVNSPAASSDSLLSALAAENSRTCCKADEMAEVDKLCLCAWWT